MKVKGSAFLARRAMLVETFGEATYQSFLDEFAKTERFFDTPILQTTQIPVHLFLKFNDELVRRFFRGDPKTYWMFGEKSGEHLFKGGPYKDVFYAGGVGKFLQGLQAVWNTFYTSGTITARQEGDQIDVQIECAVRHPYFEYTTLAFIKTGIELLIKEKVVTEKLQGFSSGDATVHYRFRPRAAA